jgi:predicted GNAT family acetyltransferase
MKVLFFDDPAEFLDVAGDALAAEPVLSTVVAGVAERIRRQRDAGVVWPEGVPCWFAAVVEANDVVGTAMRTARFGTYPAYLLPMPDEAARLLASTLLARDEVVLGANGALPAVRVFCDHIAQAKGHTVAVAHHVRLLELGEAVEPRAVVGRLRAAVLDEIELVTSWFEAFMADADEQAGRERGASAHETPAPDEMRRRIEAGRMFVWVDARDAPVSLAAASVPAYGVSRIGPVYTPPAERCRGYASRAVHEVSALLRQNGERPCLFTDQANPTSNKIYEAIGYLPLVDMADLVVG